MAFKDFWRRRKKWIVLAIGVAVAILASGYAGHRLYPNGPAWRQHAPAQGGEAAWDDLSVTFDNADRTEDNPWQTTAGLIDSGVVGQCLFLTPGTGATVALPEQVRPAFRLRVHPSVMEVSDGVSLSVALQDEAGKALLEEEMRVAADAAGVLYSPDWSRCPDGGRIVFRCGAGEGEDLSGDWLLIGREYMVDSAFGQGGYVRAATYFGDEWPANFWSSEMDHLEEDLRQIRADGFDSIVLVIPWNEFQPETDPVAYSDYAFDQLDRVLHAAEQADLRVYARIGYTWDPLIGEDCTLLIGGEYIPGQFFSLFCDDGMRAAWLDYAAKLYQSLSASPSFAGGFITWEDYWKALKLCEEADEGIRLEYAARMGYQDWAQAQYGLEAYNERFATDCADAAQIPIPRLEDPAMEAMYRFFDERLNELLQEGQAAFANLSMEVRLDADPVTTATGEKYYYSHEATYACGDADFVATMYGIPMGFENRGERVTAADAIQHTRAILENLKYLCKGKPVFVEQFVFYDNTPKFAQNARLREDQVGEYLKAVPGTLLEYTGGYGVWTYRDYAGNMLYNSGFYLDGQGWETDGSVAFKPVQGSRACRMAEQAELRQAVTEIRDHFKGEQLTVTFDVVEVSEAANVVIRVGGEARTVTVDHVGAYRVELPRNEGLDFAMKVDSGAICVDNLRLYSHVQNGYLYDVDGGELAYLEDVRELNRQLAE